MRPRAPECERCPPHSYGDMSATAVRDASFAYPFLGPNLVHRPRGTLLGLALGDAAILVAFFDVLVLTLTLGTP